MTGADALDEACEQVPRLRKTLKKKQSRQVESSEERQLAKSVAQAWFHNHLPVLSQTVSPDGLAEINDGFRQLIEYADRATSRSRYDSLLKSLATELTKLRRDVLSGTAQPATETPDEPPVFSALTSDTRMQEILRNRWIECAKCIAAGAPLAATVMMGGMLESILVARTVIEPDKAKLFKCPHIPLDRKTTKALPFQDWTLKTYIDVAHDMRWITPSAKDISEVIRDYRNYVHPHKEYVHNIHLSPGDAEMFWEITKRMTRQLIQDMP